MSGDPIRSNNGPSEISQVPQQQEKLNKLSKSDSPWHGYLVAQKDGTLSRYDALDFFKKGGKETLQNKSLDEAIIKYINNNASQVKNVKDIDQLSKLVLRLKDEDQKDKMRAIIVEAHKDLISGKTHEPRATPNQESHATQQHIENVVQKNIKLLPQTPRDQLNTLLKNPNTSQQQVSELINKKFIVSLTNSEDIKVMQELIKNNDMVKNAVISALSQDIPPVVSNPFKYYESKADLMLKPYIQLSYPLVITALEREMAKNKPVLSLQELHKNVCNAFFQSSSSNEMSAYMGETSLDTPEIQKTNAILFPLFQKRLVLESQHEEIASEIKSLQSSFDSNASLDTLLHFETQMSHLKDKIDNYMNEMATLYSKNINELEELPIEREFVAVQEKVNKTLSQKADEIDSRANTLTQQIEQLTQRLQGDLTVDELVECESKILFLMKNAAECGADFEKVFKESIQQNPSSDKAKSLREGSQSVETLVSDKLYAKEQAFASYFQNIQERVKILENNLKGAPINTILEAEKEILQLNQKAASDLPEYLKLDPTLKNDSVLASLVKNLVGLKNSTPQLLEEKNIEAERRLKYVSQVLSNSPSSNDLSSRRVEISQKKQLISTLENENTTITNAQKTSGYIQQSSVAKQQHIEKLRANKQTIETTQDEIEQLSKQPIPLTNPVGDKSHTTLEELEQLHKELLTLKQIAASLKVRPFANLIISNEKEFEALFLQATSPAHKPLMQQLNEQIDELKNVIIEAERLNFKEKAIQKKTLYQAVFELKNPKIKQYVLEALYPHFDQATLTHLLKIKDLTAFKWYIESAGKSHDDTLSEAVQKIAPREKFDEAALLSKTNQAVKKPVNTIPEDLESEEEIQRTADLNTAQKAINSYVDRPKLNSINLQAFNMQINEGMRLIFTPKVTKNTVQEFNKFIEPTFTKNKQAWADGVIGRMDIDKFQYLKEAAKNNSIPLHANLDELLTLASQSKDAQVQLNADLILKTKNMP